MTAGIPSFSFLLSLHTSNTKMELTVRRRIVAIWFAETTFTVMLLVSCQETISPAHIVRRYIIYDRHTANMYILKEIVWLHKPSLTLYRSESSILATISANNNVPFCIIYEKEKGTLMCVRTEEKKSTNQNINQTTLSQVYKTCITYFHDYLNSTDC